MLFAKNLFVYCPDLFMATLFGQCRSYHWALLLLLTVLLQLLVKEKSCRPHTPCKGSVPWQDRDRTELLILLVWLWLTWAGFNRLRSEEKHKYVTDSFFSPSRASQSSLSEISFLMEDHLLQTHTVVSKCLPNAVPSNTQGRWNKLRKYTTCFSICLVHCISQYIVYSQFYCSPARSVRFWFLWGFYTCGERWWRKP